MTTLGGVCHAEHPSTFSRSRVAIVTRARNNCGQMTLRRSLR